MQIRTFYGSKSIGVFLLYDLGDEKAPVCEIWYFYHNPNSLVDFLDLSASTIISSVNESILVTLDCLV